MRCTSADAVSTAAASSSPATEPDASTSSTVARPVERQPRVCRCSARQCGSAPRAASVASRSMSDPVGSCRVTTRLVPGRSGVPLRGLPRGSRAASDRAAARSPGSNARAAAASTRAAASGSRAARSATAAASSSPACG